VDDPGWRGAWRGAFFFLFPRLAARSAANLAPVTVFRRLFVAFMSSNVFFYGVALVIAPENLRTSLVEAIFVALIVASGVAGVAVSRSLWTKRGWSVAGVSEVELLGAYRSMFFLRMSFVQSTILLGFVSLFITSSRWMLLVGAAAGLVQLIGWVPTGPVIQRQADEVRSGGARVSLLSAMYTAPA
jgi:hypothetical protein